MYLTLLVSAELVSGRPCAIRARSKAMPVRALAAPLVSLLSNAGECYGCPSVSRYLEPIPLGYFTAILGLGSASKSSRTRRSGFARAVRVQTGCANNAPG